MKPIDYILIIGIAALVVGVVIYLIVNKKKGKTSCGCGCSGCPNAGACGMSKNAKENANEPPMYEVNNENA